MDEFKIEVKMKGLQTQRLIYLKKHNQITLRNPVVRDGTMNTVLMLEKAASQLDLDMCRARYEHDYIWSGRFLDLPVDGTVATTMRDKTDCPYTTHIEIMFELRNPHMQARRWGDGHYVIHVKPETIFKD